MILFKFTCIRIKALNLFIAIMRNLIKLIKIGIHLRIREVIKENKSVIMSYIQEIIRKIKFIIIDNY